MQNVIIADHVLRGALPQTGERWNVGGGGLEKGVLKKCPEKVGPCRSPAPCLETYGDLRGGLLFLMNEVPL